MLDSICTFPLTSDVFAQCIHPQSHILALGLATGHVQIHRLPPCPPIDGSLGPQQGTIETAWRTRRHKGSCRGLSFSLDGAFLFSAGSDGLVKAAATETGRVVSKIAVPFHRCLPDSATLIHTLSPQSFLVATDSSALHTYDLRAPTSFVSSRPQQTYHPHDDYISSLSPLPAGETSTSGFSKQWISTGGTSVGITDLRRGVLKVEDLGEELLSSVVLGDGTLVVGGERGVLRTWKDGLGGEESGRVVLGKGETLDVLGRAPAGRGEGERVVVGMGDGRVKVVDVQRRKVIVEVRHDEVEGVVAVGFEIGGRMISGGGPMVKVWEENVEGTEDDDLAMGTTNGEKGHSDDDDEDSDEVANDSSEDDTKSRKRRKKRKRDKGKIGRGGDSGKNHHHITSSFSGMD